MTLVLDSGAFLALERNDRRDVAPARARPSIGHRAGLARGVVGQVWRGRGPRHALLAKALGGTNIRPLDAALGRAAGELLAGTGGLDVIDAALVLLARDGDDIATSDPDDLEALARAAGRHVELIRV